LTAAMPCATTHKGPGRSRLVVKQRFREHIDQIETALKS
jgi:hypothetical protein